MAAKKPAPKKASKPKPAPAKAAAPKPSQRGGNPRGKKLGDRTETITERLSLTQVEAERSRACDLMRAKNELEEKKKAAGSEFTARIREVDQKMKAALAAAASGKRDVEITVEEWLTPQNQVQRYRTDTGELIGDRQANQSDLQEDLPFEKPEESEAEDEADDASEAIQETTKEATEAGDPVDGDFGEGP
jgi:hypothetical protein